MVGECTVVASKFTDDNKKIKTVETSATLSTTDTTIYTNYKSSITITPVTAPSCDLTLTLTLDDEEYKSASLTSGSTDSVTFTTTYGKYTLKATPVSTSNPCTLENADIVIQNRV